MRFQTVFNQTNESQKEDTQTKGCQIQTERHRPELTDETGQTSPDNRGQRSIGGNFQSVLVKACYGRQNNTAGIDSISEEQCRDNALQQQCQSEGGQTDDEQAPTRCPEGRVFRGSPVEQRLNDIDR